MSFSLVTLLVLRFLSLDIAYLSSWVISTLDNPRFLAVNGVLARFFFSLVGGS